MGATNKLTLKVDGIEVVKRTLKEINKVDFNEVIVITGHESEAVSDLLQDYSPTFVHNELFHTGMHSSIKTGVKKLQDCDGFFICLADQPYFDHATLKLLINNFQKGKILTPSFDGKRGHPVLISSEYISEIIQEPDGDYGCSYLLKRHKDHVVTLPVNSEGVLFDMDTPTDYERYLANRNHIADPTFDFYQKMAELRQAGQSFTIATIVEVIGSASAKTGSKAIFSDEGRNLLGWVGGGCAERFIGEQSIEAIHEGRPRTVLADLDDEIFGLGVACGGKMNVFIDPIIPSEIIDLPQSDQFKNEIRSLSGFYGWNVHFTSHEKTPDSVEELLLIMAKKIAQKRGATMLPLKTVKKVPANFKPFSINESKSIAIIGRTRITEALARHFTLLNFNVRAIGPDLKQTDYPTSVKCTCLEESYSDITFSPNEMVIIASHTAQDPQLVANALNSKASYVGMIGSYKRSEELLTHLNLMNQDVNLPISIPAGLDLDAKNPDEIALSVAAEILELQGWRL